MPASKAGHVAEGRDCECRKGRVHRVFNATYGTSMMLRPAPTEVLKDAEDAAATRSFTTRAVALELSRKIFTCAFVFVVACSRLTVQSHEGHPSSGSDSNVKAKEETPHCKAKASQTESTCKSATDLPGEKVIA